MIEPRIIETFNTHRMRADVVQAVATGREVELEEILTAIRHAATSPKQAPQPLIVYGERGSGKSFLMRMVEIEAVSLINVACVLLPEEQYNIRSAPQILEAVSAKLQGRDWSWRFDPRSPDEAWDTAIAELHKVLDARFGPGQGIVVVLLENFDTLTRSLFGAESPKSDAEKASLSAQAIEQRSAEERLRKLMNARGGRFMLVATATGTVDLDYDRPLFQAFRSIDLRAWSGDTAITYFNKRRELEKAPPLNAAEEGRARAINEFTGGNPRLAQLLGSVLSSPSARSIADTLDQLADHLADYYRRRLDDLSQTAVGLIDALVRGGEPASQSALAKRAAGQQHQIADAFSYLTRSRLVAATRELGGAGLLYRVRDRLFVHFYRRRYDTNQSLGLAPIAELLERFYTPQERQVHIREHLQRGEFDDALAYGGQVPTVGDSGQNWCNYRNSWLEGAAVAMFAFAGVPSTEIEAARTDLRDRPSDAYKKWAERANAQSASLARTAAMALMAQAASRFNQDSLAREILEKAVSDAKGEATADALILAQSELLIFAWYRLRDKQLAISLAAGQRELAPRASTAYARARADFNVAFAQGTAGRFDESRHLLTKLLANCKEPDIRLAALHNQVFNHRALGHVAETLSIVEEFVSEARQFSSRFKLCNALNLRAQVFYEAKEYDRALMSASEALELALSINALDAQFDAFIVSADILGAQGRHEEALSSARDAAACARRLGDAQKESVALSSQSWDLGQLERHEDAIAIGLQGAALGREAADTSMQAIALRYVAWSRWRLKQTDDARRTVNEAINLAMAGEDWQTVLTCARLKAQMLAEEPSDYPQAVQAATLAVRAAEHARDTRELTKAYTLFFETASHIATAGIASRFAAAMDAGAFSSDAKLWDRPSLSNVFTATARSHEWSALLKVLQERKAIESPAWFGRAFSEVGEVWAEEAAIRGRAATFGAIANELEVIDMLMSLVPARGITAHEAYKSSHLVDLVSGLLSACADPGLLRDLADLFLQVFGEAAQDHAQKLRRFAEFHEADNKERVLQRFDPDLAMAIRRMWNVPDPKDEVALRVRRKQR